MLLILLDLVVFSAKLIIVLGFILLLLSGILALLNKGKEEKNKGHIQIKNLNEEYDGIKEMTLEIILSKKQLKKFYKERKQKEKGNKKSRGIETTKNLFVLQFDGDIKASAVSSLREEVTAVLSVATPQDEVVVCLESAGGMAHAYGLASSQLSRIREKNIPLTVIIDKVAASGGYLMACVANKILAAPFSIIGSIGVIVQLPNFNRWLKDKHIDFEQLTAGNYKRTLTLFGENTEEGREKLRSEIEEVHQLFKKLIQEHRPEIDIEKVSTGEHWLGKQALELKLIDGLTTSDDYLFENSQSANVFEITYQIKKSLSEKLTSSVQSLFRVF